MSRLPNMNGKTVSRLWLSSVSAPVLFPRKLSFLFPRWAILWRKWKIKSINLWSKKERLSAKAEDGQPEIVILGFIPADQRSFSYNFVFSLSLSIMKIAERNGGRAYATGLIFQIQSRKSVWAGKSWPRLKAFKNKIDGKGILNPGKVIGYGLLDAAMGLGSALGTFNPASGQSRYYSNRRTSQTIRSGIFRRMLPGMPTAVRSAAIVWKNATSFTAGAGRARARAASGIGCANIWKAVPNGIRRRWILFWFALPANSAICAVPLHCRLNHPG